MSDFERAVVEVVLATSPGVVMTYGEVAAEAGNPSAARAVGRILATVEGLPWWRVVNSQGRLVPHNEAEHARLLKAEGVEVSKGRVLKQKAV